MRLIIVFLSTLLTAPCFSDVSGPPTREVHALIVLEAKRVSIDPSLALAVAHVESNFSVRAVSIAGARGIMQVMPSTGWGEFGIYPHELWDPRINIRVGLCFLKQLIDDYRGDIPVALSYYNGGSAVGEWPNAKVLPYTKAYVDKVLKIRDAYQTELRKKGVI